VPESPYEHVSPVLTKKSKSLIKERAHKLE